MGKRNKVNFPQPMALAAALFFGLTSAAHAAELGKASATPVLGRELDLTIPVTLDPPETEPCAEIQAYFGETRVKTLDIWVESANPQVGKLRIVSTQPVDEPVVTVYVAIKCGGQVSRKYVFFTELAMDAPAVPLVLPGSTAAASSPPKMTDAPQASVAAKAAPAAAGGAASAGSAKPRTKPAPSKPSSVAAAGSASPSGGSASGVTPPKAAQASKPAAPVDATKSRLKLEPLALLDPPTPGLRLSDEIQPLAAASSPDRQAAAAVWKTLNTSPEQLAQDSARLQAIQTQLGEIQSKFGAQQEMLLRFEREVDSQRMQNRLLIGLLILMALVAYFIHRNGKKNQPEPSWLDKDGMPEADSGYPKATQASAPVAAGQPDSEFAQDQQASSVVAARLPQTAEPGAVERVQSPRLTDSSFVPLTAKSFDVQELFDVQEQAEFFSSVGQYHRAVDVLKEHVRQNPDVSALAYLDLFSLLHKLGRRKDYDELTAKFNEQFSVEVPKFDEYGSASVKHLDDYEPAMDSIAGLWPDEEAMDVIAELIFRKPKEGQTPFSLEAYRELLMLYAILRDVREGVVSGEPFHSPGAQALDVPAAEPLDFWATTDEKSAPGKQVKDLYHPKASNNLGLDIDLSKNQK